VLDATFGEGRSTISRKNGAENLSLLRKIALSLLTVLSSGNVEDLEALSLVRTFTHCHAIIRFDRSAVVWLWTSRNWVALGSVAMALSVGGCGSFHQVNRPLEAAKGTVEQTGFARSTTTSLYERGVTGFALTTTRTGQAASVVEGPRGDRLWRISSDGGFLEFCQLLDERPYDCSIVPLPIAASNPTLVDPGNLGRGSYFSASSEDSWSLVGGTSPTRSLPTTPRFGVWVLTNPMASFVTLAGIFPIGSGLLFCRLDDAGRPGCSDTKTTIARALSLHVLGGSHAKVLEAPPSSEAPAAVTEPHRQKLVHVLWGQPVGEGVAIRCEADEETAAVKCVKAMEKVQL